MAVNITNRQAAEALIQEQVVKSIAQEAPKQSIVMQLGRRLPNMTSKQTRIPVLDMLPLAYWVNGDTGMKQTSRQAWDNVYLTAGELAVIVPVPEAVVSDADFDILGEIVPRVNEAIGMKVDEAVLFGTDRPPEWGSDIVTLARQAGNNVAGPVSFASLMGTGGLLARVEEAGYTVNGIVAAMGARAALRGLTNTDGTPLFITNMQGATPYALDGAPMYFPDNGSFDTSVAQMIAGNFQQLVYAIRQDVSVKMLTEGVIQDPADRSIVYNLAQQDMVALRVVFRMGWALPNPASRLDPDRLHVPFAYLEPATAATTHKATFTVKDDAATPAAVAGAMISLNGARKKTDASGKAVYDLRAGSYPYTIKAEGYRTMSGSVTVASTAVSENVTLPHLA